MEILDMPWSNVHRGQTVRWATPAFVLYARVVKVKGQSMTIRDPNESRDRVIPDARWYFVRGKEDPQGGEGLWVIDRPPTEPEPVTVYDDGVPEFLLVYEIQELLGMDPKQVRRHIRNGVIPAFKNAQSQWVVRRKRLMEVAAQRGWL